MCRKPVGEGAKRVTTVSFMRAGRTGGGATATSSDVPWPSVTGKGARGTMKAARLDARPRNWQIDAASAQHNIGRHDGEGNDHGSGTRFHPRHRRRRSRGKAAYRDRDPVPAGAE